MKTITPGSNLLRNAKTLPGLTKKALISLISILLLCFSYSGQAQQAQNIDQLIAVLLASSDPALVEQGLQLNQLINEANPTLTIYNGEFSIHGGTIPLVLDVHVGSLSYLHTPHPDFESIQLIRVRLQEPGDMSILLQLDELTHFENLGYVFFLATYEICPENPGNDSCHSFQISNLVTGLGEDTPTVIYKVVIIM